MTQCLDMLVFIKHLRAYSFYFKFLMALHNTNSLLGCPTSFPAVFHRPCRAHARRSHKACAPDPGENFGLWLFGGGCLCVYN